MQMVANLLSPKIQSVIHGWNRIFVQSYAAAAAAAVQFGSYRECVCARAHAENPQLPEVQCEIHCDWPSSDIGGNNAAKFAEPTNHELRLWTENRRLTRADGKISESNEKNKTEHNCLRSEQTHTLVCEILSCFQFCRLLSSQYRCSAFRWTPSPFRSATFAWKLNYLTIKHDPSERVTEWVSANQNERIKTMKE